jgi:hypothetical protein
MSWIRDPKENFLVVMKQESEEETLVAFKKKEF